MRGHQQLIDMRKDGFAPDWVFIDLEEDGIARWDAWVALDNTNALLLVESKDRRPDMRCVTGLKCFIEGEDSDRVHKVRDACIAVGAARVIATVTATRRAEFRTIEITDTAGIEGYLESEVEHG